MKGDRLTLGLLIGVVSLLGWSEGAIAQLIPDQTLGSNASIVSPFSATIDRIDGGATRGINLFHSFREFNIGEGRSAYFVLQDAVLKNVFARVTGSNRSEILGTLGVSGGNANLFLINPNGILFGPNSSLDVGGSFAVTTANAIEFGDRGVFSATNPANPSLLTVDPSVYLFSQVPTGIIVNRSVASNVGLQVPNGQSLTLLGGDVLLEGGRLRASGGRVDVGAVASPGRVEILPSGMLFFAPGLTQGTVILTDGGRVDVMLNNGGDIDITARDIRLAGGSVLLGGISTAGGTELSRAGDIRMTATGTISLDEASRVQNAVAPRVTGSAGNVQIMANVLKVTGGAGINATTFGFGNAGNIVISVRDRVLFQNSSVALSSVAATGTGKGGNVEISSGSLEMRDGAQLVANTRGQGDAGNIVISVRDRVLFQGISRKGANPSAAISRVEATGKGKGGNVEISSGSLEVRDGALLLANTLGAGDAGNVLINVRDSILFQNSSAALSNVEVTGKGKGGNVEILSGSLEMLDGAQLVASTLGTGNAGNVVINTHDRVLFQRSSAALSNVLATGKGKGGNVEISSGSLEVRDGAQLVANTGGEGNAGNVVLNVRDRILFQNGAAFSSVEMTGKGKSGNLEISSRNLEVRDGSALITSTFGRGDAGNVVINVQDRVLLDGIAPNDGRSSAIFTNNGTSNTQFIGTGAGGNVLLTTSQLEISNGAVINARTVNDKPGGNIGLNLSQLNLLNGGQILSTSDGSGSAGRITINTTNPEERSNLMVDLSSQLQKRTVTLRLMQLKGEAEQFQSIPLEFSD